MMEPGVKTLAARSVKCSFVLCVWGSLQSARNWTRSPGSEFVPLVSHPDRPPYLRGSAGNCVDPGTWDTPGHAVCHEASHCYHSDRYSALLGSYFVFIGTTWDLFPGWEVFLLPLRISLTSACFLTVTLIPVVSFSHFLVQSDVYWSSVSWYFFPVQ